MRMKMVSKDCQSYEVRILIANRRIERLEEKGEDMGKTRPIMELLNKLMKGDQKEKLDKALERIVKVIEKKEGKVFPDGAPPLKLPREISEIAEGEIGSTEKTQEEESMLLCPLFHTLKSTLPQERLSEMSSLACRTVSPSLLPWRPVFPAR